MDNVQRETIISGNEYKEIDLLVTDIDIKPIIKKVRHFALINEENKFCYVNRRFCQLFGKITIMQFLLHRRSVWFADY